MPIVIWNKLAEASLKREYKRIKEASPQNAEKEKSEILAETRKLAYHPEMYPPDKFKFHNSGNFRAFEKYSYRVAYKYTLPAMNPKR